MSSTLLNKLKIKMPEFTAAQRKVADYIIKNPADVAFLTTEQLAALTEISVASIMRLAYSMGYTGYAQLQKDLQDVLKDQVAPSARFEKNTSSIEKSSILTACVATQIANINKTAEFLSASGIKNSFSLINKAKKIYIIGVRTSHATAYYLYEGLNRIGLNCELLIPDTSRTQSVLAHMSSENLLIAISLPRYAKRTIEIANVSRKKGAKIIAITDAYSSPLAIIADETLLCTYDSVSFHNSGIGSLFLADFLISGVASTNPKKAKASLDNIENIVKEFDANAFKS